MKNILLAILIISALLAVGFLLFNKKTPAPVNNELSTYSGPSVTPQNTSPVQKNVTPSPTDSGIIETAEQAVIKTSKGDITIQLFPQDAPKTVSNFVTKAKSNYYNNLTFHRVEDWVVQGGDPAGNGTGGGDMDSELNDRAFVVGSVGVARASDIKISNDSQFFITKTDSSHLNKLYTNFGIVLKGMDVVNKLTIGDKILSITAE